LARICQRRPRMNSYAMMIIAAISMPAVL